MNKTELRLRQNAWFGDAPVRLQFPAGWDVKVIGDQVLQALSDSDILEAIRAPIGMQPLSLLASGKTSVAILLDDLSRPTPVNRLLPIVLQELYLGGVAPEQIALIFAGGTHKPMMQDELAKKIGRGLPPGVQVIPHDCHQGLVELGHTSKGTPIKINRRVVESELKIGIGCIYPHPAAGFSGGAKILAPGAAGFETIRYMHDNLRGSKDRAGSIHNQFREDIEEIAVRVGFDFIVNVAMNQDREIAAVFAGDRGQAFDRGVDYVAEAYAVDAYPDADITIVDMYPFDVSFQVAYDRGFWPLELARRDAARVILAGCPQGLGKHDLFPVSDQFYARLKRRIENFRPKELLSLGCRLQALRKMIRRKRMEVFVVSETIPEESLKKALPKGRIIHRWDSLVDLLLSRYQNRTDITVAVYRCAPLMLPRQGGKGK